MSLYIYHCKIKIKFADGFVLRQSVFDEYGDGLCGSCFGGIDGEVIVTRGNCDTIYELYQGDADFGFVDSSMLYNMVIETKLHYVRNQNDS